MTEPTDEKLVGMYQAGDRHAGNQLCKRWWSRLVGLAFKYVNNQDLAEEAAQTALLRFFRWLESFDTERRFEPLILAITKNAAIDIARREPQQASKENGLSACEATTPAAEWRIEYEEARDIVRETLQGLSDHDRLLIAWRYSGQYTYEEIGKAMGIRAHTVKYRHRKALHKLRAHMVRRARRVRR